MKFSRFFPLLLLVLLTGSPGFLRAQLTVTPPRDLNALILKKISEMPAGGTYGTNRIAKIALQTAAHFESGRFFILPSPSSPSFCSGATYLVFLKAIEDLRRAGSLTLDHDTLVSLVIREHQPDGDGIWGRWNANGPGTARLFYELGLGPNFDDYSRARPGDFMKIFWTEEVGRAERGHSVIYLGTQAAADGVEHVLYWSSNQPDGYGIKPVPRAKIAQVIFSRLEQPQNLARIKKAPAIDEYLASLLTVRSSYREAKAKCGF